jgi:hypothetical protein
VKNSNLPLAAVVWDDAKATAVVEYDLNEVRTQFHKAARYTTYGLLVIQDDKGITLASEEGDDQNLRGLTFIPRQMVVEVVLLGKPRARKARQTREAAAAHPSSSKSAAPKAVSGDQPLDEPRAGSDDDV